MLDVVTLRGKFISCSAFENADTHLSWYLFLVVIRIKRFELVKKLVQGKQTGAGSQVLPSFTPYMCDLCGSSNVSGTRIYSLCTTSSKCCRESKTVIIPTTIKLFHFLRSLQNIPLHRHRWWHAPVEVLKLVLFASIENVALFIDKGVHDDESSIETCNACYTDKIDSSSASNAF